MATKKRLPKSATQEPVKGVALHVQRNSLKNKRSKKEKRLPTVIWIILFITLPTFLSTLYLMHVKNMKLQDISDEVFQWVTKWAFPYEIPNEKLDEALGSVPVKSEVPDDNNLSEAEIFFKNKNYAGAITVATAQIKENKNDYVAGYIRAQALDKLSELKQSNALLEDAIHQYENVLFMVKVPEDILIATGIRCADRQSFRGWGGKAINTMRHVISILPKNVHLLNKLGELYLIVNKIEEARSVFESVLDNDVTDGFALAHLGFIVKTTDENMQRAVELLEAGIRSGHEGTHHGRFYYHLGDALMRIGQVEKGYDIYSEAAKLKLFPSKYQRSMYNVERLDAKPWWTVAETGQSKLFDTLEKNWKMIRDEVVPLIDTKLGLFVPETENLKKSGMWHQFVLWQQGFKEKSACSKVPKTCQLVEKFGNAIGCTRGQIKFSIMQPGTKVWPHTGPTNCRLRSHLGLVVPDGVAIRVAEQTKTWQEGKILIFDDSFEHEVWHNGTSMRLVLIVDIWHPEITSEEKKSLSPI